MYRELVVSFFSFSYILLLLLKNSPMALGLFFMKECCIIFNLPLVDVRLEFFQIDINKCLSS